MEYKLSGRGDTLKSTFWTPREDPYENDNNHKVSQMIYRHVIACPSVFLTHSLTPSPWSPNSANKICPNLSNCAYGKMRRSQKWRVFQCPRISRTFWGTGMPESTQPNWHLLSCIYIKLARINKKRSRKMIVGSPHFGISICPNGYRYAKTEKGFKGVGLSLLVLSSRIPAGYCSLAPVLLRMEVWLTGIWLPVHPLIDAWICVGGAPQVCSQSIPIQVEAMNWCTSVISSTILEQQTRHL